MNVSAVFEYALAQTLRAFADVGPDTVIRVWQNLRSDPAWRDSAEGDRALPCIDIRCTPPQRDENQVGLTVTAQIECRAKTEDDRDHAEISKIFDATQTHLDALYDQFFGTQGDELAAFLQIFSDELASAIHIGGFTFGDSSAPFDDDGQNVIAVNFVLHYARQ
jgi:hypothetical protein